MPFLPKAELEFPMFEESDLKRQKIFFVMLYSEQQQNSGFCLDQTDVWVGAKWVTFLFFLYLVLLFTKPTCILLSQTGFVAQGRLPPGDNSCLGPRSGCFDVTLSSPASLEQEALAPGKTEVTRASPFTPLPLSQETLDVFSSVFFHSSFCCENPC